MLSAQSCQAERAILTGILFITNAQSSCVKQPHYGCQHLLMWQPWQRQVPGNACADLGQCLTEGYHTTIFRLVAHLAPVRMVAILLATFCITSGRLNVPIWPGAYPHMGPGRWYTERANTFQFFAVVYWFSIKADITKVLTNPLTPYTRCGIANIAQPGCFSHYCR